MNKKLLIAAVGAALVVGVTAAQADVKLGGYVNMSVDSIKGCQYGSGSTTSGCANDNSGAANRSTTSKFNVSSNTSRISLNASDDLGGGLKVSFAMDTYFKADQNNGSGSANTLWGGNTALMLGGDWGTVGAGNWDSGAKQVGTAFDLFRNQLGDNRNLDVNNNRVNNLLFYISPNMSGFSALVAHSTTADSVSTAVNSPTTDNSTTADSLMLKYVQGPLSLGLGYDALKKNGTGTVSSAANSAKWTNLGGKYTLDSGTSFVLFYQKHDNATDVDTTATGFSGKAKKTTGIGVSQKFDNNMVKLQFYKLKDDAGGALSPAQKLDAKMTALGFDHIVSKSFTMYVDYAKTSNDTNAAYTAAAGGHGDQPAVAKGKSSSGFGVGAIYTF